MGIACLGLVPTLGGPDQPLHWAMTAGMVGFGALLLVRHRLRGGEAPLADVEGLKARHAGRAVLIITGILAALVSIIVAARVGSGGGIGSLSLLMPAVGLVWLGTIGFKSLRQGATFAEAANHETDRPSRRPPDRKPHPTSRTTGPASSDRHASV